MDNVLVGLGWIAGLAIALYASEKLVHYLTELGAEVHIPLGLLGLLVAFGADAPEVTSALIAVARGSSDVGLGVIVGSNIYNLAGLLGISALVAGRIATNADRLTVDGGTTALLTLGLAGLVVLPGLHRVLGVALLLLLLAYLMVVAGAQHQVQQRLPRPLQRMLREAEVHESPLPTEPARRRLVTIGLLVLCVVFIVVGSDLLVNTSITLGARLGLSSDIIGTFILAIATSLPNTWAAVSLARRGFGAAAVATTFSSNSINAAVGAGLPSLFVPLHASAGTASLDALWLLGMTALAIVLLATRWSVTRQEGLILIAGYSAFVLAHLVLLR